jgi:hypothetical protein
LGGGRGGIKAGTDEIEDAAEGEVVANDLRELGGVSFGIIVARTEVGDGEANFFYAEARAGAEPGILPLLCTYRTGCKAENGRRKQPTQVFGFSWHYYLQVLLPRVSLEKGRL